MENNIENTGKYLNGVEFLYHATPSCYINSIKKNGLGGKMPKVRFWDYKGTPYEKIEHGVFLATDEYVAESYIETSESYEELEDRYDDLEIVVFKVAVKDLDENLLTIDTNQITDDGDEPTFFYNGVIDYDKLEVVEMYEMNECDGVPGGATPMNVGGMGDVVLPGSGSPGSADIPLPNPTGGVYTQVQPFDQFIKKAKWKKKKKKFKGEKTPNGKIYSYVDDFKTYAKKIKHNA